jgi:hypothetical protein
MYARLFADKEIFMRLVTRASMFSFIMSLFSVSIIFAQVACPDLVSEALATVDSNCSELGRNEACYGFDQVEASFLGDVGDDFFVQPADIAAVADLETIRTAPLNLDSGTWGVAVMNLQANMPDTLPGQNVTFVLMGDVEVENAVAPEDAFVPSEGIDVEVSVVAGANIRSGPGTNFNVLGGVQYTAILQADGLSQDGEWLRVAYRERPAWISKSVIVDNPAIAELPSLSADLYTAMQAFYLRTGIGQPECNEAPENILLVQGPENIEISLSVNGADVSLGSSGAFRTVEIDGKLFLEIIVFDGTFRIGDTRIRRGQHSFICLGDESNRGLDGESNDRVVTCDPTPPENVDMDVLGGDWCVLEHVSANILNYGLDVPCPGETAPPANSGNAATGSSSQLTGVDCSTFAIVSPLAPVDAGNQHFEWTTAPGADLYVLVFYNSDGAEVNNFSTANTFYDLNLGADTATGGSFSWEVRAYQGGAYACVTGRSGVLARYDAGSPPGSNFSATMDCMLSTSTSSATISWYNASSGSVLIQWSTGSYAASGDSGSYNITVYPGPISNIQVTADGQTINLGNC